MTTDIQTAEQGLEQRARRLHEESDRVAGMTARYLFDITGDGGGTWTLDIVDGAARLEAGEVGEPDIVVRTAASDFVQMINGQVGGQELYMSGKLHAEGNIMLAMQLGTMFGDRPQA